MSGNPPGGVGAAPDRALVAANTALVVRNAYTTAMMFRRNEQQAYDTAVRAWRERHPNTTVEEARLAVAAIICGKV